MAQRYIAFIRFCERKALHLFKANRVMLLEVSEVLSTVEGVGFMGR
jgi:hypothetical protein